MQPILVVDDDAEVREALRDALELEGYPVGAAADVSEALALLDAMPRPGLVLLDRLADEGSSRFLASLRERGLLPQLPVVVCTGSHLGADGLPGACEVLPKPVTLEALLAVAERYAGAAPPPHGSAHSAA